jgi:hypothetical protein
MPGSRRRLRSATARRPRTASSKAAQRRLPAQSPLQEPATHGSLIARKGRSSPASTRRALRSLAARWQALDREVCELEREIDALNRQAAPPLTRRARHRPKTAARLLIVASDNPERIRGDGALAALCGASAVGASSGKIKRYRVNRGGDRQDNNALWTIANNRFIHHPETRAYAARRTAEELSRKETLRCRPHRRSHPRLDIGASTPSRKASSPRSRRTCSAAAPSAPGRSRARRCSTGYAKVFDSLRPQRTTTA